MRAVPAGELDKWVAELERINGKTFASKNEQGKFRGYFVTRVSVVFEDLKWNARAADALLRRAQTLPASEANAWKEALEGLLKRKVEEAYAVPLVLIPVAALHDGEKYNPARGQKYRARLKQLTAEDISLWRAGVDRFGGTDLDAAVNIVLMDDFFAGERFQRDKFRAAIEAARGKGE